ncbi:helix-turn-helix domain-containing protein [Rhizobium sp. SGZ-381]|uniref:helix-turn-helix domain-containing protein n=1 Tax=Rhizobium sp. SGZ-381 TaxID=3342800 RepID=UPI003672CAF4
MSLEAKSEAFVSPRPGPPVPHGGAAFAIPDEGPVSDLAGQARAESDATGLSDPVPLAVPSAMPPQRACGVVRHLVGEVLMLMGDRPQMRRDRRRALIHIRQISMYVCHVSLGIPQSEIGEAFGRDRTTVGHACAVVEERRENAAFDDFVATIERIANAMFGLSEVPRHD